jgi:hypothetical protein
MAQQHAIDYRNSKPQSGFKSLSISDKEIFDYYLSEYPPENSEFTFTNLFIWDFYYNFEFTRHDDALVLVARPQSGPVTIFPPIGGGDPSAIVKNVYHNLLNQGLDPLIQRVPETMARQYFENDPQLRISLDRDNSDYVYKTEDLIDLKGRDYQAKRNHINKFNRLYKGEYVRIKKENVHECLLLQETWCNLRDCTGIPELHAEDMAIRTAMEHFDELDIRAGAISINGKIEAFSMGGRLNKDTAVVHIEKANPRLEGLYQVINQQFALYELANYEYINREQDLGDAGLRKAKLSYYPHHMVNKFSVRVVG